MIRSKYLIVAVLLITIATISLTEFRFAGLVSLDSARISAYALFALNAAVALAGIWTNFRIGWMAYFGISLLCMMAIGAATPFSAIWSMVRMSLGI